MPQAPPRSIRNHAEIAETYCRDVLSGTIPACKWVRAACQRQADDLANQGSGRWLYEPSKGSKVCKFTELLRHVKGPKAGKPIRLEPWQIFILMTVFSWVSRETGKRRFRRVYLECPKGQGKSLWSSAVALYMLALDGEAGAEVYSAATTRDQAKIVFGVAQQMARKSPEFCQRFGVEVSTHSIHIRDTMSWFRPLASEANSLEGVNPHFVCIDELHAHENRSCYDNLVTAAVKRDQPLIWCITTAGSNREGVCYEVRSYRRKSSTVSLTTTASSESFTRLTAATTGPMRSPGSKPIRTGVFPYSLTPSHRKLARPCRWPASSQRFSRST